MRKKVRTTSDEEYADVVEALETAGVDIALEVPRRHLLAVEEDLPDGLEQRLHTLGAVVESDTAYSPEATA